ncbi:MAG: hypothetical protein DME34_10800 [Verrucomicrobia bacterium]|nr:MAG: hypothetical protein DME34_10800 [Verrucomicrobiota bacterium]
MPGKQSTACSVRRGGIMLDEELCQAQTEFMKLPALLIWSAFLASSPIAPAAETQTPDPALYGPYPANYKEIVTDWLQTQLIDPSSARIEWKGEPKPADLGKSFTVNARNRFGTYTGKQEHGALIRNGEVVKGIGFGY